MADTNDQRTEAQAGESNTGADNCADQSRWPITTAQRKAIVERLAGIATSSDSKPRQAISASRVLVSCEGQNQADENKPGVSLAASGTLLTPDADAAAMDATVPRVADEASSKPKPKPARPAKKTSNTTSKSKGV